jgi:hypothetical protein
MYGFNKGTTVPRYLLAATMFSMLLLSMGAVANAKLSSYFEF